jgi:hypothetical protein
MFPLSVKSSSYIILNPVFAILLYCNVIIEGSCEVSRINVARECAKNAQDQKRPQTFFRPGSRVLGYRGLCLDIRVRCSTHAF